MGQCCPSKEKRKSMYNRLPTRQMRGKTKGGGADDAANVMNAIAAELWPTMAGAMLDKIKQDPIAMKPYEMHVVGGDIGFCPTVSNVKIVEVEEGQPVTFTCDVNYECQPELDFQLAAMKNTLSSMFMPDVTIALHWVYFSAKLHIDVSMVDKVCHVYFVEPPDVKWDLDVEVSKLEIPINVEDKLDVRLEKEFGAISQATPKVVAFGTPGEKPTAPPPGAPSRVITTKPRPPSNLRMKKAKRKFSFTSRKGKEKPKKEPHVFKTSVQKDKEAAVERAKSEMFFPQEEMDKMLAEGKTEKEINQVRKEYEKGKRKGKSMKLKEEKKQVKSETKEKRKVARDASKGARDAAKEVKRQKKEERRRSRKESIVNGSSSPRKRLFSWSSTTPAAGPLAQEDDEDLEADPPLRRWTMGSPSPVGFTQKTARGSLPPMKPGSLLPTTNEDRVVPLAAHEEEGWELSTGKANVSSDDTATTASVSWSQTDASSAPNSPSARESMDSLASAGITKPEDPAEKKKKKKKSSKSTTKKKSYFYKYGSKSNKSVSKETIAEEDEAQSEVRESELTRPSDGSEFRPSDGNVANNDPRMLGD
mmetsp:Transcript_555/g.1202  ORF Transcript_555/g.1202 Transcript_555/m.1202 type:complete len:589 (-) Transcript_555:344-2110(-)